MARVWRSWRGYAAIVLMGLGLAALTEFVQLLPFIGRDAGIGDAATDFLGVVLGLALAPLLEPSLLRIENRLFGKSSA